MLEFLQEHLELLLMDMTSNSFPSFRIYIFLESYCLNVLMKCMHLKCLYLSKIQMDELKWFQEPLKFMKLYVLIQLGVYFFGFSLPRFMIVNFGGRYVSLIFKKRVYLREFPYE